VAFELEKFRAAIKKAGFETRDFELTLQARVERRGDTYELRPGGVAQAFAVRAGAAARELEPLVGKTARVKGKVAAEAPTIELELIEVTPGR